MALLALVALPLVFLKNDDFLASFVFQNFSDDRYSCEHRGADLERVAFAGGQHIGDRDGIALFRVREAIHRQNIALGDDELLALGFDSGFHKMKPRNKRFLLRASKEIFYVFPPGQADRLSGPVESFPTDKLAAYGVFVFAGVESGSFVVAGLRWAAFSAAMSAFCICIFW